MLGQLTWLHWVLAALIVAVIIASIVGLLGSAPTSTGSATGSATESNDIGTIEAAARLNDNVLREHDAQLDTDGGTHRAIVSVERPAATGQKQVFYGPLTAKDI